MFFKVSEIKSFLNHLPNYWKFLRSQQAIYRWEVSIVMFLALATIVAEVMGVAMLLPILSYVEHEGNIDSFATGSRLGRIVIDSYAWIGVPISLVTLSSAAFFAIVLRQVLNFYNGIAAETLKFDVARRLSVKYIQKVFSSSAINITSYNSGSFLQAADIECQTTASILRVLTMIWINFITVSMYCVVLVLAVPLISSFAIGVTVLIMAALSKLTRTTSRLSKESIVFRRENANFIIERFHAWKLIKLSNNVKFESDLADVIQKNIVSNRIHMLKTAGVVGLIFIPAMTAFMLVALYMFVHVLFLDIATITSFSVVLLRLMPVGQKIQQSAHQLAQCIPSYTSLKQEFWRANASQEDTSLGKQFEGLAKEIRFDNVSFCYPSRDAAAINDVSVVIKAGMFAAIVGKSGAGKSTFIDFIPRLISPDAGQIFFDDEPVSAFNINSIRSQISYVAQEPFLFNASIAENLRYMRPDASQADLEEAAELAHASEFIEALPQKFNTIMGDAGENLSGGQRQRLALARAFLSKASILVLDEPTSALDYESEHAIKSSIEKLIEKRGVTVIVIAHRLSTVRNADLVIHMDEGRIYKIGSADEVLNSIRDAEIALN